METNKTKTCAKCGRTLPIASFRKTRWGGISCTCKDCIKSRARIRKEERKIAAQQKQDEALEKASKQRLASFTARELLIELKERGYKFVAEYEEKVITTVTHTIKSEDLDKLNQKRHFKQLRTKP